jgi:alpha-1,3-mannosyltransferase
VEAIRVLGPENCALSIVEGRSSDGTYEVLTALNKSLPEGVDYYFSTSEIDPTSSGRIGSLAELRNLAIKPLTEHRERFSAEETTVIFFNDVAACPDDVLELVHQRVLQEADMTCAMDWNYVDYSGSYRLTFYDVWIARTMSGQSFFHIPFGGSWNESMHLFWSDNDADRLTKARFERGLPFQVFTCWNGGVVFTAKPIMNDGVQFRLNRDNECYQGEVSLFTKDMWIKNYSRIAVIPSVNLAYDDDTARRIQGEKGLPSQWVQKSSREGALMVPWSKEPPEKVLCIPDWVRQQQYWVDWNE